MFEHHGLAQNRTSLDAVTGDLPSSKSLSSKQGVDLAYLIIDVIQMSWKINWKVTEQMFTVWGY